jgi:hypothetical protein
MAAEPAMHSAAEITDKKYFMYLRLTELFFGTARSRPHASRVTRVRGFSV